MINSGKYVSGITGEFEGKIVGGEIFRFNLDGATWEERVGCSMDDPDTCPARGGSTRILCTAENTQISRSLVSGESRQIRRGTVYCGKAPEAGYL